MTNTEIIRNAEEARLSRQAASRFIRDMEPFIRSVSARFLETAKGRIFQSDIFVSAETGFYKAVMSFDFSKKGFISYARKAIEMEVRLFLSNETRTVRLPRYVTASARQIDKYRIRNGEGDREGEMKAARITSEKTYRLIESARSFDSVSSLDAPLSDKGTGLEALIPGGPSPEDVLLESEMKRTLYSSLETLPPSERYIIIHSYGLGGADKKKNSVMALDLGISAATVRNRRKRALASLRAAFFLS